MAESGETHRLRPSRVSFRDQSPMHAGALEGDQRRRLLDATTNLVVARGYGGVTVSDIVGLAGVSKTTFYREFDNKAEAFAASVGDVFDEAEERMLGGGAGQSLEQALGDLAKAIIKHEEKAKLVFLTTVEIDAAVGREVRAAAGARYRELLQMKLRESGGTRIPATQLCGLAGGIEEVIYRRLHDGELERLRVDLPMLASWVEEYGRAFSGGQTLGQRMVEEVGAEGRPEPLGDWRAELADPEICGGLSQRERIVRATGQLVSVDGYAGLSVARISGLSGTSNQTFYENFDDRDEAFLAAFDELSMRAFMLTVNTVKEESDLLRAAVKGLLVLMGQIAADPIHQRLVFVELAGAGPAPLARAEAMLDLFVGFLEPEELPRGAERRPPRTAREAIGGGLWAIVRQEIQAGRGSRLVEAVPGMVDFATIPFGFR